MACRRKTTAFAVAEAFAVAAAVAAAVRTSTRCWSEPSAVDEFWGSGLHPSAGHGTFGPSDERAIC